MNIAIQVILLVVGIAVVLALVALPIVLIYRSKYRAGAEQLDTELAAETVIRPLEKGNYRVPPLPVIRG